MCAHFRAQLELVYHLHPRQTEKPLGSKQPLVLVCCRPSFFTERDPDNSRKPAEKWRRGGAPPLPVDGPIRRPAVDPVGQLHQDP